MTERAAPGKWLVIYGVIAVVAALYLAPIVFMIVGSLKADARVLVEAGTWRALWPGEAAVQNYRDVFARVNFGLYLANSLFITLCVVGLGLVVNALAGYALARMHWRGRNVSLSLVLALIVIPFEAIAVPLFFQVTTLGWRDTYSVQIIPFVANAFSIYLFYSFFIGLPRELEEAARIDGAGPWRTFLLLIVPNSKPVFASVAILTFLVQWGSFLWPLMVTSGERVRPLPVAIAQFHTLPPMQWGDILAFGVMMVMPILLVFLLFQRWFVQGVAAAGVKG